MFATLAGGYPWPRGVAPGDALGAVLEAQVDAGLGLLADGRVHPAGAARAQLVRAWRATREAAVRLACDTPVKIAISGPWAAGGPHRALAVAASLGAGLADLAEAGCPVVEIHEPAGHLPTDERGRVAFAEAHTALLEGLGDLHATLAITGGDALAAGAEALFAAPYRSYLLDLLDGPESWRLAAVAPGERGIVAGVGDASGRRRTRLEDVAWAAGYAGSMGGRGMDRVGVAPSGSLAGLPAEDALAVLRLLGGATAAIGAGRDLVASFDPRAIDARTSALGQYRLPGRSAPIP